MDDDEEQETNNHRSPGIKIRPMEIDDLPVVFHMGETLFEADKFPNLYRTWDQFELIDIFNSDPEYCLVAELNKEIAGFALGTTITKNRSAWKYGWLIWLGVQPEYHRMGIAEKLFARFRTLMLNDGVRMLMVDSQAENIPALKFFRKMGFGSPRQHIYLSMNIAAEQQMLKERRKKSARNGRRKPINGSKTSPNSARAAQGAAPEAD